MGGMSGMGEMGERIFLREALASDLDRLAQIHLECVRELCELAPEGFGQTLKAPLSLEEVRASLETELEDARSVICVAEIGGEVGGAWEIAGFALGWIEEHSDDLMSAPFLTIVYLETAKEYRKRGIGRALLLEMERLAKQRGLTAVDLEVWFTNKPAMRLYVQAGYKPLEMRMAKGL